MHTCMLICTCACAYVSAYVSAQLHKHVDTFPLSMIFFLLWNENLTLTHEMNLEGKIFMFSFCCRPLLRMNVYLCECVWLPVCLCMLAYTNVAHLFYRLHWLKRKSVCLDTPDIGKCHVYQTLACATDWRHWRRVS